MKRLFVTGIGTGVGKTVAAAALVDAFDAAYWKPIQAGDLHASDTLRVQELIPKARVYPEAYRLREPRSPHEAAQIESISIKIETIEVPEHSGTLVIEGAGGLFVPLNDDKTMLDLLSMLDALPVVVIRHYLGSINHTLLTLEALKRRSVPVRGLIWNGSPNPASEEAILRRTEVPVLARLEEDPELGPGSLRRYRETLRKALPELR